MRIFSNRDSKARRDNRVRNIRRGHKSPLVHKVGRVRNLASVEMVAGMIGGRVF